MQNAELIHYVFMLLAIVLEVAANILIKYSDGFRKRMIGTLASSVFWPRSRLCRRQLRA